jgi:glycosyltransferase involved in cell wall biosynthesis
MLRIVHVVPEIDVTASGLSLGVCRLAEAQAAIGASVELFCLDGARVVPGVKVSRFDSVHLAKNFDFAPRHGLTLRKRAADVDIIHNHSLWQLLNIDAGLWARGGRARLVSSPHGTMAPWARAHSGWKKRLVWPLQRVALDRAHLLHATGPGEAADLRGAGFRQPILMLPLGIDVPPPQPRLDSDKRTLLFLGRLHPVKALDRLLSAWSKLAPRYAEWELRIVGVGEPAHEAAIRQAAASLPRVVFAGAVDDLSKWAAYWGADLFVLPSHTENFGIVVAEALAAGIPAVVSHGAPWQALEMEGAGVWTSNAPDVLASALDLLMALAPDERAAMGARGRAWMERDFSWERIARKSLDAYSYVLGRGSRPTSVID